MRIDKVYTKGGDAGQTSLIGGERVSKANPRIDAYGTLDELNAVMGLVRTALDGSPTRDHPPPNVHRIQNELFNLGAELACGDADTRAKVPWVEARLLQALVLDIDAQNDQLAPCLTLLRPRRGWVSSYLHLARTVCRRAERLIVALAESEEVETVAIIYLNRLSDALFVFGRWAVAKDGQPEPLWTPEST